MRSTKAAHGDGPVVLEIVNAEAQRDAICPLTLSPLADDAFDGHWVSLRNISFRQHDFEVPFA
jgi:hypothetical protein